MEQRTDLEDDSIDSSFDGYDASVFATGAAIFILSMYVRDIPESSLEALMQEASQLHDDLPHVVRILKESLNHTGLLTMASMLLSKASGMEITEHYLERLQGALHAAQPAISFAQEHPKLAISTALMMVGTFVEIAQRFQPEPSIDPKDHLANMAGIAVGLYGPALLRSAAHGVESAVEYVKEEWKVCTLAKKLFSDKPVLFAVGQFEAEMLDLDAADTNPSIRR